MIATMTDLTRFATNACLTAVALRNAIFGFDKTSLANNDECPTTKTFCALFAAVASGVIYPIGTLDMCRKNIGFSASTLIPSS